MKTKFTSLFFLLVLVTTGYSQQPANGGFNTFTNPLNPDNWTSLENLTGQASNVLLFQDMADKVEGASSLKLICDTIPGFSQYGNIGGLLGYGSGTFGGQGPNFPGVAFTGRPDTLIFDYKRSSPTGVDSAKYRFKT